MNLETQAAPAVEEVIAPAANEPTLEDVIGKNWEEMKSAPRDEQGKFTRAIGGNTLETPNVSRESTELPTGQKPATDTPAVTPVAETPQQDTAPSSWRKEAVAKWATLDPDLKAEVLKRETDFHKGTETYKQKAAFADEIQRTIAPYQQNFAALGIQPTYAIKTMFEAENMLRNGSPQQKAQLFQKWAQDYGVDLGQMQTNIDPHVAELQQKVSNYEAAMQHQRFQQESQAQSQLTSTIEDFAKNHEHLESVRVQMGSLLASGAAKDLQDAYDQAIWTNPDIRATLLAKQQEEAKAKARQIAEEAKRTAATNVRHRGTVPAAKATGTLDEVLRENAQNLGLVS